MYIYQASAAGEELADAMMAAAARGVSVIVVYDRIGSMGTPERFWRRLQNGGVRVYPYRPFPGWGNFWVWLKLSFLRRNHRKLLIVDSEWACTGSFNIMRECSRKETGPERWVDLMLMTDEPHLVREIEQVFLGGLRKLRRWRQSPGYKPKREREATVYPALNGEPRLQRLTILRVLKLLIRQARTRVVLVYPYFIPSVTLVRALRAARNRGVAVEVFLSLKSDLTWINDVSFREAGDLLHHGISVRLYEGSLSDEGRHRFNHAKLCQIDDWVGVGSANADRRSFRLNLEHMLLRYRPPFQKKVDLFLDELRRHSRLARPDDLRYGLKARLLYPFRWFL